MNMPRSHHRDCDAENEMTVAVTGKGDDRDDASASSLYWNRRRMDQFQQDLQSVPLRLEIRSTIISVTHKSSRVSKYDIRPNTSTTKNSRSVSVADVLNQVILQSTQQEQQSKTYLNTQRNGHDTAAATTSRTLLFPKVMVADVHHDELLQVLVALSYAAVQSLEICNCSLLPHNNNNSDEYANNNTVWRSQLQCMTHLTQLSLYSCQLEMDQSLSSSQLDFQYPHFDNDAHVHPSILYQFLTKTPMVRHLSLYLVAGTINHILAVPQRQQQQQNCDSFLPHLVSLDWRGNMTTTSPCFHHLSSLRQVVLVGTMESQIHLSHVLCGHVEEYLLGKLCTTNIMMSGSCNAGTVAADDDNINTKKATQWGNEMQTMLCNNHKSVSEILMDPSCRIRKLHLLTMLSQESLTALLCAVQHNTSLFELVFPNQYYYHHDYLHINENHHREGAVQHEEQQLQVLLLQLRYILQRNRWLHEGLGRLSDIRLLPHYLEKAMTGCLHHHTKQQQEHDPLDVSTLLSSSPSSCLENLHFMVRERPDLFGQP